MNDQRLKILVWKWKGRDDLLTVETDREDGGGTRISGPKRVPGCSDLLCQFDVSKRDIEAMLEDIEGG